ncbi:hypothetical protein [Tunturiibacter gelidiferens]|uniref:hypothetical protein n=1 Tax=Tunturiibacter gelidiferens TaxID=3069689 RepID=UPI003D9B33A0
MLDAGEEGWFVVKRGGGVQAENEACAALCAGMLGEEENACLASLCSSTITEPCCEGDAGGELGSNAAQVQHDCAEPACLK